MRARRAWSAKTTSHHSPAACGFRPVRLSVRACVTCPLITVQLLVLVVPAVSHNSAVVSPDWRDPLTFQHMQVCDWFLNL